jgi:cytochrome c-type biogenesis protein CcmH
MKRRVFLTRLLAGAAGSASIGALARRARAQAPQSAPGLDTSNLFAMDQAASRPVRLPPKPGARAVVSTAERDELEHRIRCQCGCTLDVYTCRTTDFACEVSPAMHRDIIALIDGGYGPQEIIDAFVGSYGEKVLMAPTKSGFNLVGWGMPFGALIVGGGLLAVLLRRWRRRGEIDAATRSGYRGPARVPGVDATDSELARLDDAVRGDGA